MKGPQQLIKHISFISLILATLCVSHTTAQVINIDKIDTYNKLIKEKTPLTQAKKIPVWKGVLSEMLYAYKKKETDDFVGAAIAEMRDLNKDLGKW